MPCIRNPEWITSRYKNARDQEFLRSREKPLSVTREHTEQVRWNRSHWSRDAASGPGAAAAAIKTRWTRVQKKRKIIKISKHETSVLSFLYGTFNSEKCFRKSGCLKEWLILPDLSPLGSPEAEPEPPKPAGARAAQNFSNPSSPCRISSLRSSFSPAPKPAR